MTLSTTSIDQFGARLYQKMIHQSRLDPDACAAAYQEFVRRMKAFRKKHPDQERVTAGFVRRCERWITANLLKEKKRKRIRAALEQELSKQELARERENRCSGNTLMFQKLAGFISHWTRENSRAAVYARVFLLAHAWNMEPKRVRLFGPLVDGKKSAFVKQIREVKEHVAGRLVRRLEERARTANYWYCKSLKADLEAKEEFGGARRIVNGRRAQYAQRQQRALDNMEKIKTSPSVAALAKIAGVTPKQVRYACQLFRRELKRYFAE